MKIGGPTSGSQRSEWVHMQYVDRILGFQGRWIRVGQYYYSEVKINEPGEEFKNEPVKKYDIGVEF